MKLKNIVLVISLLIAFLPNFSNAAATELPVVESFKFTPNEIDILSPDTIVNFELVISHPFGIENPSSFITIKDFAGSTWGTSIFRKDIPMNPALEKVTYTGSLTLPRTISTGVYSVSASEVKNNKSAGYSYGTGEIFAKKIRDLKDAENSFLVRSGGSLNYIYKTFQGPSFDSSLSINYKNTAKYNSSNKPIWKVGEYFDPNDFYESKIDKLDLQIKSSSSSTCTSNGKILKLIATGNCEFVVYTPMTNDFAIYEDKQTVLITNARMKSTLYIPEIENQTAQNLPKVISLPQVYSAAEGYVLPLSTTPAICVAVGFSVRLISGGTCTLAYKTSASSTYLASDLYQQSFEITRKLQTLIFTPPSTINVAVESVTLSATASSGEAITYSSTSPNICTVSGPILSLRKAGNCSVTVSQAGTSTLAPVSATATIIVIGTAVASKKTITCTKGKTSKKVTGTNPKCPTGYKPKK
jgi:hypothetical protein